MKVSIATCVWVASRVCIAPILPPAVLEGVGERVITPERAADEDSTAVTLGEATAEGDATPLLLCCKDAKGLTVAPAEPLDPAEAVNARVALAVVEGEEVDDSFDPCAEREREGEGEEEEDSDENKDTLVEKELEALNVSCEEKEG